MSPAFAKKLALRRPSPQPSPRLWESGQLPLPLAGEGWGEGGGAPTILFLESPPGRPKGELTAVHSTELAC